VALSQKQERFVEEYMVDSCGKQAAIRAGYSPKTAHQQASRMVHKSGPVKDEIDRRRADLSIRTGISAERVLKEYARIAFSQINDIIGWAPGRGMTMVPSDELSADDAACIAELNEVETIIPSKKGEPIKKIQRTIKLHPKGPALDKLAQHLGICKEEKRKVEVDLAGELVKVLTGAWGDKDNGKK
jgi:phage terminase small subunit